MKKYKRFGLFLVLMCLTGAAFAIDVWWEGTGTMPTDIQTIITDILGEIGKINDNPKKFIKGFADASVFASHTATQRAYGEYKLWAFTFGAMAGFRLPVNYNSTQEEIENLDDKLKGEGDLKIGANIQTAFQLGINTSGFLLDGLYLGLRFGYVKIPTIENLDFQILHIGPVVSYQFLKGIDAGFFKWRGLTASSGFLYQKTSLNYSFEIDDECTSSAGGYKVSQPKLNFNMDIKTFTIPLELNTSILFLWFLNLDAGIGVDIAFGKNSTYLKMDSDVIGTGLGTTTGSKYGKLVARSGGSMAPTMFNPKVMTNLGFKLGPVIIDVPVTYYLTGGTGFSVGLTLGAVW